jgi:hypothetical protein
MNINNNQADLTLELDFNDGKGPTQLFAGAPWNMYSGGELTATDAKVRAGSMGAETSNGGPASRSDGSMSINWSDTVIAQFQAIENRVGKGKIIVSAVWLDGEGVKLTTKGSTMSRSGTLLSASSPEYDANGNAVGMFTVTFGLDEVGTST